MAKVRDFNTIEQAINHALKDLSDEDIKDTKKKISEFRKYSDPKKAEYNISHIDSIAMDIALMKKGKGHPLLDVHNAIMEAALEGPNFKPNVTQSLLTMGERIGKLMGVTEQAMDPSSPGGAGFSKEEKDKIYKAIKELEEKITNLKSSIK